MPGTGCRGKLARFNWNSIRHPQAAIRKSAMNPGLMIQLMMMKKVEEEPPSWQLKFVLVV